jgi:hypothetical protein
VEEKKEPVKPKAESGAVVPVPAAAPDREMSEALEPFGDLIPFADPSWYQGVSFPLLPGAISAMT